MLAALYLGVALLAGHAQTGNAAVAPCSTAETTSQASECEQARLNQAESDLDRVYMRLLQSQNALGKRRLRLAEAAWLRFREANAQFHAGAAHGGTLEPLLRVTSMADATEVRAAELRKMLP